MSATFYRNRWLRLLRIRTAWVWFLLIIGWISVTFEIIADVPQPVGYFKMGPLRESVKKGLDTYNAFNPSAANEMIMGLIGGMLGDPSFESISSTSDINFVFYNASVSKEPYLAVIKLSDDSPIRDALTIQGLSVVEIEGWTMVAKDPVLLEMVAKSRALRSIVLKKRGADFEIGMWVSRLLTDRILFEDGLFENLSANDDISSEFLQFKRNILGIALDELFSIDTYMTGVNISEEAISIKSVMRAREGSDLALLLSQKTGGEIPAAKFILPDGMFSYMGRVDIAACQDYFDKILDKIITAAPDDWGDRLHKFKKIIDSLWTISDGSMAGALNLVDGKPAIVQAGGSLVDSATFAKRVADYIDFVNSEIMAGIPVLGDSKSMIKMEFIPNAFDAVGEPIHKYRMDFSIDPRSSPASVSQLGTKSGEEDMVIESGAKPQAQEFYYAVVNGLNLGTSNDNDMIFLVDDVLSGQPLEKNLGKVFETSEAALQYRIDLTQGLVMAADKLHSSRPDLVEKIKREAAAGGLRPIRGIISIGDGQIGLRLNLPVTTIGRWISMYRNLQQAQDASNGLEL